MENEPHNMDLLDPDNWQFPVDGKIVNGSELTLQQKYTIAETTVNQLTENVNLIREAAFLHYQEVDGYIAKSNLPFQLRETIRILLEFEAIVFMKNRLEQKMLEAAFDTNDDK